MAPKLTRAHYVARSNAEGVAAASAAAAAAPSHKGSASGTWDPPSVAAGATTTTTLAVSGCQVGDSVAVGFSTIPASPLVWLRAYVSAAGTVTVVLHNGSAGAVDLASGTLKVTVFK